ncbi:ExbD/TolR family protein [Rubritalea tangerina]|uniref:ExbD/TolR family protein n=1 Tax=Rubritalea tangerina TaxID=430798 RepID=A0ABW4Z812_9BACT
MKLRNKHGDEDEIEVSMSPLIDCVFLLLIFFLVTTMLKKPSKDIDVNLPYSNAAVEMEPNDDTVIGIDRQGRFYFDGVRVGRMELRQYLSEIAASNPEQGIRLDCDQKTKNIHVSEVLDLCNFYQINNVGVRTYDESYNQ